MINVQKSITYSNEQVEFEVKNAVYISAKENEILDWPKSLFHNLMEKLTWTFWTIQYLDIHLTKHGQELYEKN